MELPPNLPPGARRSTATEAYSFWLIGDERAVLRDAYHVFLRLPWAGSLGLIALGFFAVNVVFACFYYAIGGVDGVHDGSFFDALSFSVQTLGTIGYGVMSPRSHGAHVVMIVEAIVSIIVTALATGLVFTKFARATARVAFSKDAVITAHDGKPTLTFRVGNRRSNLIVEPHLRVTLGLTTVTAEGMNFYKLHDLALVRDRQSGLRRGWTVMHVIDETSPLYGFDAAALAKAEAEIQVSLVGFDDVTMQTVHSIHQYADNQIKFGHRFVDILTALANGDILVDLRKFDSTVPDDTPRDSVAG
jgi:inward rectifier potassium channel